MEFKKKRFKVNNLTTLVTSRVFLSGVELLMVCKGSKFLKGFSTKCHKESVCSQALYADGCGRTRLSTKAFQMSHTNLFLSRVDTLSVGCQVGFL